MKITVDAADLTNILKGLKGVVGTDRTRPHLHFADFTVEDNRLTIAATNGCAGAVHTLDGFKNEHDEIQDGAARIKLVDLLSLCRGIKGSVRFESHANSDDKTVRVCCEDILTKTQTTFAYKCEADPSFDIVSFIDKAHAAPVASACLVDPALLIETLKSFGKHSVKIRTQCMPNPTAKEGNPVICIEDATDPKNKAVVMGLRIFKNARDNAQDENA
jgi:hypothetical protein